MGFAFLQWERLPAYMLGPLFALIGILCLVADDEHAFWNSVLSTGLVGFGVGLVAYRFRTGREPFWPAKNADESKHEDDSN